MKAPIVNTTHYSIATISTIEVFCPKYRDIKFLPYCPALESKWVFYISEARLLILCLSVSLVGRCDHCCGSLHDREGLQQTSGKKTEMGLKKY